MLRKKNTVEVIKPKKQHDFKDLIEAPFENMDYIKKQDRLLIEYREQEIQLLTKILEELQKLTSLDVRVNKEK